MRIVIHTVFRNPILRFYRTNPSIVYNVLKTKNANLNFNITKAFKNSMNQNKLFYKKVT